MSGSLRIARGPRAAEDYVLGVIEAHQQTLRADPRLLATPLRVVVPSQSLREHLVAAALRHAAGALAGVAFHTLRGLAFDILSRRGESLRPGDAVFPVLVRQCAREQALLRRELDSLQDGFGAVVASVSDLLDADFVPEHHYEALDECLATLAPPGPAARARAVLRAAAGASAALAAAGLEHRSSLFRRAREQLEADPGAALPAAGILVHGYADATGVQADLLRALVASAGAELVLDRPDDPAHPGVADAGGVFTDRLLQTLETASPERQPGLPPPADSRCSLRRAPGAQAEVRHVAESVAALLDQGVVPERIGIVARQLEPYLVALRLHLGRLGIPFSGAPGSPGPMGPAGRALRAALELIRRRDASPADRWLDALAGHAPAQRADLRTAFHALGLGRVRDVAGLDIAGWLGEDASYALPVRHGLRSAAVVPEGSGGEDAPDDEAWSSDDGPAPDFGTDLGTERQTEFDFESGSRTAPDARSIPGPPAQSPGTGRSAPGVRAPRRKLKRAVLEAAVADAAALARRFQRWARVGSLAEHLDQLEALLRRELGWSRATPGCAELQREIQALRQGTPGELALDLDDFVLLLGRRLRGLGSEALGGAGGGVAVLSVVEARARTFDQLFVLGMNRDLFPRAVEEDPLLPDAVRRRLESVLPDIPIKARGYDEERYLFAQLVASSPEVTLSWQVVSDDGKERSPSPLCERLRLVRGGAQAPLLPGLLDAEAADARQAPRSAHEHAVHAALRAQPERLRAALALAEQEAGDPRELTAAAPARARADARLAVLRELEGGFDGSGRPVDLGPYFGFLGPLRGAEDPRSVLPAVTTLEALARCGWRTFMGRLLHLEAVPDARSALPGLEALSLGNLVHGVLERIAADAGVPLHVGLADLADASPRDIAWPGAERLEHLLEEEAQKTARQAGIGLRGFPRLLAELARPALQAARRLDWAAGVLPGVLGAEVEGRVEVVDAEGTAGQLRFRADRVDAAAGGFELVDYKAGRKLLSGAQKPETRRGHLLAGIRRGHRLQVPAYAQAVGASQGHYLFLGARGVAVEGESELRRVAVERDDAELRERFEATVGVLLRAWREGSFVPRFLDAKLAQSESQCDYCEFAEACLRGDSGASRRLRRWLERPASRATDPVASVAPVDPDRLSEPAERAERALRELWELAR